MPISLKSFFIIICTTFSISILANNPAPNYVRGEILCQLHNWNDTNAFTSHAIPFQIEIVSSEYKIICLHYDYKLGLEKIVISDLIERFPYQI